MSEIMNKAFFDNYLFLFFFSKLCRIKNTVTKQYIMLLIFMESRSHCWIEPN